MISTRVSVVAFCLFLLSAIHLQAQAGPTARADVPTQVTFSVQPGDILRVGVWPELSLGGDYPIEESGLVFVPILGGVQVSGLTLNEVRATLREGFGRAMQAPVVTVIPLFNVSVLGAVVRPGLYQVEPSNTVFDVISPAGGLRSDAEDDGVVLLRGEHSIPLAGVGGSGFSGDQDVLKLRSGDRIMVRRGKSFPLQAMNLVLQGLVLAVTLVSLSR